jgi:hypothetical protein
MADMSVDALIDAIGAAIAPEDASARPAASVSALTVLTPDPLFCFCGNVPQIDFVCFIIISPMIIDCFTNHFPFGNGRSTERSSCCASVGRYPVIPANAGIQAIGDSVANVLRHESTPAMQYGFWKCICQRVFIQNKSYGLLL